MVRGCETSASKGVPVALPDSSKRRAMNMPMMGNADMPLSALRRQIAGSVDPVVRLAHLRSGHRCVTSATNVVGIEKHIVATGEMRRRRPVLGEHVFEASGRQPSWMPAVEAVDLREPFLVAGPAFLTAIKALGSLGGG